MLLQVIIGASLKTLEYFRIGTLHLLIAFWMSNRGVANLNVKIFALPLEGTASKLGPIVADDHVWDTKSVYDELDEFHCELFINFDHWGCFRAFGEVIDDDIEDPVPSDSARKWPHDIQPPHNEGP
jgi:hypothetical protein